MQYGDRIDVAEWFAAFCNVWGRSVIPEGCQGSDDAPAPAPKFHAGRPRGSRKVLQVGSNHRLPLPVYASGIRLLGMSLAADCSSTVCLSNAFSNLCAHDMEVPDRRHVCCTGLAGLCSRVSCNRFSEQVVVPSWPVRDLAVTWRGQGC